MLKSAARTPSLIAALLASGFALAQTSTTGAFMGRVLGKAGAPLEGATLSLTSNQITRIARTGPDGKFSLNLLTPGSWRMSASREGYQTVVLTVQVVVNDTRNATLRMSPLSGALVEVTASSSTVDVTTAQQGLSLVLEDLAPIPVMWDMNDLILLAPGVQDGGFHNLVSGLFRASSPSISGASAAENQYYVDGLVTTDQRYGTAGASLPPDFVDQAEILTGAFKPEYSALGGVFNSLVKSGTNTFKGAVWSTYDPFNGYARQAQNAYFVAPQRTERWDCGYTVGGPLVKDQWFFFTGVDYLLQKGRPTPNYTGEVSDAQRVEEFNCILKINGYLTPDQQVAVTWHYNPRAIFNGTAYSAYGPANIGNTFRVPSESLSLTYDLVLSPTLFLSLKAGRNVLDTHNVAADNSMQVWDGVQNAGQGVLYGGFGSYLAESDIVSQQFKADLSWVVGSHALKFGVSLLQSRFSQSNLTTGPDDAQVWVISPDVLEEGISSTGATVLAKFLSYYAQDTWEWGRGLSLAYGLRFDGQEQYGADGNPILVFDRPGDYLQPRLSLIWDLHRDGKAKLAANYGVYYETIPQALATSYSSQNVGYYYYWTSPAFTYDPTNPNHYGTVPGGIYTSPQPGGGLGPTAVYVFNAGPESSNDPVENGIKLPKRVEYALGFDQQFTPHATVGIHGKYRKLTDIIEDSAITDANGNIVDGSSGPYAPHFILWNPGPGPVSYSTSASWDPNPHAVSLPSTLFPSLYNLYRSVDLTFDWHTPRNALNASYTWSRNFGNYEGVVSASTGAFVGNMTGAVDYWPYYGTGVLPEDRTHMFKAFGTTRIPSGKDAWEFGFTFLIQSGVPISLWDDGSTTHGQVPGYDTLYNTNHPGITGPGTVAATAADYNNPAYWSGQGVGSTPPNGGTYYTGPGYPSLDVGGYGGANAANFRQGQYGRTPINSKLDLHGDFDLDLGGGAHLVPSLAVFNAFNTRTVMTVNMNAATGGYALSSWGQPSSFQDGRSLRLSVKLKF